MDDQDSFPSTKTSMPLFPEDPRWPDEWVSFAASDEPNSHFQIYHLEECLKRASVLTRTIKEKTNLELWVPTWRQAFALGLATEIMGETVGSMPVTINQPKALQKERAVDPAELVAQITSEVVDLHLEGNTMAQRVLPLRHSRPTWQELAFFSAELVCALLLYSLTAFALVTFLWGIAASAVVPSFRRNDISGFVALVRVSSFFAMTAIALVFGNLRRKRHGLQQRARNSWAESLLSAVLRDEPSPAFTFYLRPFQSDYRFIEGANVSHSLQRPGIFGFLNFRGFRIFTPRYFFPDRSANIELLFGRALWPLQPLIAIGKFDERPGAGLVELKDDEWKQAFAKLALRATTILVLPGTSKGSLFEVAWIQRHSCLNKLLLFKPRHEPKYEQWWSSVRNAYSQLGVPLPVLNDHAGLLCFDDGLIRKAPLGRLTPRQIRRAFSALHKSAARGPLAHAAAGTLR